MFPVASYVGTSIEAFPATMRLDTPLRSNVESFPFTTIALPLFESIN